MRTTPSSISSKLMNVGNQTQFLVLFCSVLFHIIYFILHFNPYLIFFYILPIHSLAQLKKKNISSYILLYYTFTNIKISYNFFLIHLFCLLNLSDFEFYFNRTSTLSKYVDICICSKVVK